MYNQWDDLDLSSIGTTSCSSPVRKKNENAREPATGNRQPEYPCDIRYIYRNAWIIFPAISIDVAHRRPFA